MKSGSGIVWRLFFFPFCFLLFPVLSIFLAICRNLELEAAISTVFAPFWSPNLLFWMEFATFWRSNCSCNMVVCNWNSSRVRLRFFARFGFRFFKGLF